MIKKTTKERLTYLMNQRQLRQVDILNLTIPFCVEFDVRMNKSDISQYVSGKVEPNQKKLFVLAKALNVNEAWLMGFDVPMEREQPQPEPEHDIMQYDNVLPIETRKIPLLGEIACGKPIFAVEDRESYVVAGANVNADFCVKAKGDSMINARVYDGDIVFIKKQPMVDNGEIAAVIIDDEVTLKRVYYYPTENTLSLLPENSSFAPMIFSGETLNRIKIIGKAIAFQSDLK